MRHFEFETPAVEDPYYFCEMILREFKKRQHVLSIFTKVDFEQIFDLASENFNISYLHLVQHVIP